MQLLPETAVRYDVVNLFDPAQNIEAGTHYLKDLLARYNGNLKLASSPHTTPGPRWSTVTAASRPSPKRRITCGESRGSRRGSRPALAQ